MLLQRCQVCGGRADRTDAGYLYLAQAPEGVTGLLRPEMFEGHETAQPPVCAVHAQEAVKRCPPLVEGHVVLRAAETRLHGVLGTRYFLHSSGAVMEVPGQDDTSAEAVPYRDAEAIRWVLATSLVRKLRGITITDLGELL
ncbi:hypothetical protein [Streptomyces paludis]|nr:hypothetical protein [Streptomyces paludis]